MDPVEISGRFLVPESREDITFPGALLFLPEGAHQHEIVIGLGQAKVPYRIGTVKLVGHYLLSTLRGMKVIEMESICENGERGGIFIEGNKQVSGVITKFSQCLILDIGNVVFVTLEQTNVEGKCIVVLRGNAVLVYPYLQIGNKAEFTAPQAFRWKSTISEDNFISMNSHYNDKESDIAVTQYYLIELADQVHLSAESGAATAITATSTNRDISMNDSKNIFIDENMNVENMNTDAGLDAALNEEFLVTPGTLLEKERLSGTEFAAVTGIIKNVHPSGWIEIECSVLYRKCEHSLHRNQSETKRVVEDYLDEEDGDKHGENTVHISNCLVYFCSHCVQHLRLTAIGVSVRRGATIRVSCVIPVYLWGRMKGLATTCRSNIQIVQFADNKQFASSNQNHCAVTIKIPTEMRKSCVLYTAWRVEISRKVAQANRGVGSNREQELEQAIVCAVEKLAAFSPIKGNGNGSVSEQNASHVRKIMKMSPRVLQEELFNLNSVLLYTLRNGHDGDWLGNSLPQLHTPTHMCNKLQALHRQRKNLNADNMLGLYHYDICAVPKHRNYWVRFSRAELGKAVDPRKNVALIGVICAVVVTKSAYCPTHRSITLKIKDSLGTVITVLVSDPMSVLFGKIQTGCSSLRLLRDEVDTYGDGDGSGDDQVNRCATCGGWRQRVGIEGTKCCTDRENKQKEKDEEKEREKIRCRKLPPVVYEYRYVCLCSYTPARTTSSTSSSAAASARSVVNSDVSVAVIHRPKGLVENIPALARTASAYYTTANAGSAESPDVRLSLTCHVDDIQFISAGGAGTANDSDVNNAIISHSNCTNDTAVPPVIGVRQLLSSDLQGVRQKYFSGIVGVVTHIQVLAVEYLSDATTASAAATEGHHNINNNKSMSGGEVHSELHNRKRKAVGFNSSSSGNAHDDKKCSVILRDVQYPDAITLYSTFSALRGVLVGNIVELGDAFACLPESGKKLYLKPVDPTNVAFDVVGMVDDGQLSRLCEQSSSLPDPRFVDAAAICWAGSILAHSTRQQQKLQTETTTSTSSSACSAESITYDPFLLPPPKTSFRWLTQVCSYQRALWVVQCQVVFVRKITVSLRCSKCSAFARVFHKLCGYECSKCRSPHHLHPLWEAQFALDDGTAEANAFIEGDSVLRFLRARFDSKGVVLQEVSELVNEYVRQYGSLVYDAFERPGFCEFNKPYSVLVEEQQQLDKSNAKSNAAVQGGGGVNKNEEYSINPVTAAVPTNIDLVAPVIALERAGCNNVFDIPVSARLKKLTSFFPLRERPSHIKVGGVLKAYMQVGNSAHQFAAICRVDFSATSLKLQQQQSGSSKLRKREVKVQKNNTEKPYLAYFSYRPTNSCAKLNVQVLHVCEIHGAALAAGAWDLLSKLQNNTKHAVVN